MPFGTEVSWHGLKTSDPGELAHAGVVAPPGSATRVTKYPSGARGTRGLVHVTPTVLVPGE